MVIELLNQLMTLNPRIESILLFMRNLVLAVQYLPGLLLSAL